MTTTKFTTTVTTRLLVQEYIGHGQYPTRGINPGTQVTITYNPGATNCGVHVFSKKLGRILDRDFSATPDAVLAATGVDPRTALEGARRLQAAR